MKRSSSWLPVCAVALLTRCLPIRWALQRQPLRQVSGDGAAWVRYVLDLAEIPN